MKTGLIAIVLLLTAAGLASDDRAPYTHDTVTGPIRDCFRLDIPEELGNQKLALLGLADVTAAPFNADPTGKEDATAALQRAIDFARDHQMVCYFPAGTYSISDTLKCYQGYYRRANGKVLSARMFPCVLLGPQTSPGGRPVIRLQDKAVGFTDPDKPKYLIHFKARSTTDPSKPQPNISFNQLFANIDIHLGTGNPGAIGIRHRAAQGSGVQDCSITATGAFKGLEGGAGSGGSHANIIIGGGRIGADLMQTQPAPTLTGITLIGQSESALVYGGRQALTAVGLVIGFAGSGPMVKGTAEWNQAFLGPMNIIDSRLVYSGEARTTPAIVSSRSVYLRNVYLKDCASAVRVKDKKPVDGRKNGWMHIKEYAAGIDGPVYKKMQYRSSVYIKSVSLGNLLPPSTASAAPPRDLQTRHVWKWEFPSFNSGNAVNVKDAPYKAKGDGFADDTEALQKAIDKNEIVFLPKGIYRVTRTIELKPETKLVGIAKHLSLIAVTDAGKSFGDHLSPQPVVRTADDADAETILAFCGIYVPFEVPGAYALEWRCGRKSIFREAKCWLMPLAGYGRRIPKHAERSGPLVRISGNGGGRWYNFFEEGMHGHPDFRHLLIENTREPLSFYHLNAEHAHSDANMEIRGASNVMIYGLKGEFNAVILKIMNSNNIKMFGYGGNASAYEGKSLFLIENSTDITLTNLYDSPRLPGNGVVGKGPFGGGTDPTKWSMVIEKRPDGKIVKTAPLDRPVLYKN
ncbi:glycosyl hydrolase family 28-related protein [Planctomycetota bacterium]